MKTLVLGLDGACRPVLGPLFDDGVAPRLRSIFDRGASGALTSQIPPWTPSAWPSLYAGVNPGKHGVFGFLRFDGYDWDVVNRSDVAAHALWELLDERGHRSVVVNVPVTHPVRPFDGALVPGYTASESPTCHPEGLLADVEDAVGEYAVYGPLDRSEDADLDAVAAHVRRRGDAFRYLADRFDSAFGFLEFQATDSVFHARPDDCEAVRRVYGAVDDAVGTVLDACDPDAVFVVSDHGIGPYEGYDVRVNEVLRDAGLVTPTTAGSGMPSWDAIARNRLQDDGGDGPDPASGALARMAAAASRVGVTSQRIQAVLEPLGLADAVARLAPTDAVRAGTEQVDFAASRAYARDRIELGVRLNLAGREPDGVVPPDEYDAVREEVIDALRSLQTPDGEPAFETVAPREAIFSGPHVERAPDVVTVPAAFDHTLNVSLLGDRFDAPFEPWNHKRDGVIAAAGAGIDETASLDDAHLFDVAPTVLSAMGVPRSDRMDGSPLPVVEPTPDATYPSFDGRDRDATDDAAVEERLAHLGYLSGDAGG